METLCKKRSFESFSVLNIDFAEKSTRSGLDNGSTWVGVVSLHFLIMGLS